MKSFFSGNMLWHLIGQSDGMSKLVMLVLLGMSILCWTVFLCKVLLVSIKKRQCKKIQKELNSAQSLEHVIQIATKYTGTMPGYLLSKNIVFLKSLFSSPQAQTLTTHEWEMMQIYSDQVLDTMVTGEESYLPLLSTSAAVAPLLGLFGTVWGLVHSFMSISEKQVADIATIAPGIAEALMTTLAGLMLAIPALVMFNYLQRQVRSVENKLIEITDSMRLVLHGLRESKGVYHASNYAPKESSISTH